MSRTMARTDRDSSTATATELVTEQPLPGDNHLFARLQLGPHKNLVYVLADPDTRQAAVIDPAFEVDRILEVLEGWDAELNHALFTHNHWDHIEGAKTIHKATGCRLHIHAADAAELDEHAPAPDRLHGNDTIPLGGKTILCHHTPGHTQGSITYQLGKRLFTGDFLFIGTAGRTDFPTGSKRTLWQSIQHLKKTFTDEYIICPGHDYGDTPEATLGEQKKNNPALAHTDYDAFEKEWFLEKYD
jgi:hydroxyacylglutathione hydrolase